MTQVGVIEPLVQWLAGQVKDAFAMVVRQNGGVPKRREPREKPLIDGASSAVADERQVLPAEEDARVEDDVFQPCRLTLRVVQ